VIAYDDSAGSLYRAALPPFVIGKSLLRLTPNEVTPQNLPPALAETIPNLPSAQGQGSLALVCVGTSCLPPVSDPEALACLLRHSLAAGPRNLTAAD
jgi:hypothetical protein